MKLLVLFMAASFSFAVNASLNLSNSCPDLEGSYVEERTQSPLTMTSAVINGTAQFNYAGDIWIADKQKRDTRTGVLVNANSDCFAQISCSQKKLTRHWECAGAKNDEYYTLDANGDLTVVYRGDVINAQLKYLRR